MVTTVCGRKQIKIFFATKTSFLSNHKISSFGECLMDNWRDNPHDFYRSRLHSYSGIGIPISRTFKPGKEFGSRDREFGKSRIQLQY